MTEPTEMALPEYQNLHPADLADRLQRLPSDAAQRILLGLPRTLGAAALDELEKEKALELLEAFDAPQLGELFLELPPNAVADLAAALPPSKRRAVLAALPADKAKPIHSLLRYRPDTAGGIMSDRFIALRPEFTIQHCQ
ncbi:MAG: hypothetical protein AB1813_18080, partial [Verrucomicrobiota bacterium]